MIGNFDVDLLRLCNSERGPWLDRIQWALTASAPWVAFGLPILFALLGLVRKRVWLLWVAAMAAASVLSCALVVTVVKLVVGRPRPFLVDLSIVKMSSGGGGSFPSGHTSDAFAIAVVLVLVFRRYMVAVPALLWALGVGWSRVALGVHYPSDVLGGILFGTLSAVLWSAYFKKRIHGGSALQQ